MKTIDPQERNLDSVRTAILRAFKLHNRRDMDVGEVGTMMEAIRNYFKYTEAEIERLKRKDRDARKKMRDEETRRRDEKEKIERKAKRRAECDATGELYLDSSEEEREKVSVEADRFGECRSNKSKYSRGPYKPRGRGGSRNVGGADRGAGPKRGQKRNRDEEAGDAAAKRSSV